MGEHFAVHGGTDDNPGVGGQNDGGEKIVGHAVRQPGHGLGRGRRDEDKIAVAGQRDMGNGFRLLPGEHVGIDPVTGKGGKGERRHEPGRRFGHDHLHLGAFPA